MADDEDQPEAGEPPPRRRREPTMPWGVPVVPATITPESKVSLTVWKVGTVLAAVFMAGWLGNHGYQEIRDSIRQLDERLVALTSKVDQADPARLRDDTRRQVMQLLRGLVIECPRPVRKGETVAACKVVLPPSLREETP